MNEGLIMNETHYVLDVLLMFEISYNLRMREGAECGGSPLLRMRGERQILFEYELEFCFDMSRQGYI